MTVERAWWKEAVVYQIYPRSFNDSDGDGNGDLHGIVERADYLADLGVDVVWLNPVYESPMVDNGYDISDYRSIHEWFGSMGDWEDLLAALHDRDIKLVMDLAVNHTSDRHEWFLRSQESTEGAYRDYYVWHEGDTDAEGDPVPPSNWASGFDGPAWTYHEPTEEWYLHLFAEEQPDLNWENPEVREEVKAILEFWLEKGIDGFRLDVINLISKPQSFPDGDPDGDWVGAEHFANGPRVHEFIAELYDDVLADHDIMTVGETIGADVEDARQYTLPDGDGLSMVFHFDHVTLDFDDEAGWYAVADWDLLELKEIFTRWQEGLSDGRGWNSLYMGNHDWPRMVSRFGNDGRYRRESAKLLGTFLHTLQGTPYLYQGDEIGMTNYPFESLAEIRDVDARNRIERMFEDGEADAFADVRDLVRFRCRDNARTPMQWDDSEHAGFTDGDPWIGVNPNHERINVEAARADPDSIWQYYRDLIDLREDHDVIVYGDYDLHLPDHERLYVYTRTLHAEDRRDSETAEQLFVVLNFSDHSTTFEPPDWIDGSPAELLIGNYERSVDAVEATEFRPWEARVYRME